MILDFYFRRPVLIDYIISFLVVGVVFYLFKNDRVVLPTKQDSYALTGDLTNISLTMAGFILTILTVLITFKDNAKKEIISDESSPVFNKFFSTDYYYETVRHLKNCIKSIVFIAAIGFFLKIFISDNYREYFFFYNIIGLIIMILTVWRCLLILSKILKLQKES